ncbi:MAG: hypothetical protein IKU10_02670 [Clostridia bacterium]|nr:hypothetical protein [Clostridia bacterium]
MDARKTTPLSVAKVTKLEWNRDYSPLSSPTGMKEVFVFYKEVTVCLHA